MSKQQAQQFLEALQNDESLANNFRDHVKVSHHSEIKTQEQAQELIKQTTAFASKQGYEFTGKEYAEAVKETDYVQDGQLSEKELESVSGGTVIVTLTVVGVTIASDTIFTAVEGCF